MVEGSEKPGLPLGPAQPLRVFGDSFREYFDSHLASELGVLRPIDLPHPAFADRLEDLVVGQFVTRLDRHDHAMLRRWWTVGNYRIRAGNS